MLLLARYARSAAILKKMAKPNLCEQLTEIFKGYYQYQPKVLEVSESYHFHHTLQRENKTITEYANKLKRLAIKWNLNAYRTRALGGQRGSDKSGCKEETAPRGLTFE